MKKILLNLANGVIDHYRKADLENEFIEAKNALVTVFNEAGPFYKSSICVELDYVLRYSFSISAKPSEPSTTKTDWEKSLDDRIRQLSSVYVDGDIHRKRKVCTELYGIGEKYYRDLLIDRRNAMMRSAAESL